MRHTARSTMLYFLIPILLLMLVPVPVSSSDAQGNYVALGFGLESCQTFLQARSKGLDLSPIPFAWRCLLMVTVTYLPLFGTEDGPWLGRAPSQYRGRTY